MCSATERLSAAWRRDMEVLLLRPLGAVLGPALAAVLDALGVEHAADDVIAHAGQVLDAAAADHHHRVLLQIVALARDVADHLKAVGEAYLGDLTQGRVGLLRGRGVDPRAHPALLRTRLHVARLFAVDLLGPRLANQLLYRRHAPYSTLSAAHASSRAPNSAAKGA